MILQCKTIQIKLSELTDIVPYNDNSLIYSNLSRYSYFNIFRKKIMIYRKDRHSESVKRKEFSVLDSIIL